MNWLKKGPELKKPSLEVPPFLGDLYHDLRERRLLPIIALVIVAIAAVPFLLAGEDEEEAPPAGTGAAGAVAGASKASAPSFTVVESKPGLRDYHKRLDHLSPTDPFKQRHTTTGADQAQLPDPGSGETTVTVDEGSESTTVETETTKPSGPDGSGVVFFAWAIDVKITKAVPKDAGRDRAAGSAELAGKPDSVAQAEPAPSGPATKQLAAKTETEVRHRILPQTALPGDRQPVVTYMGRSRRGLPLFLVSDQVRSVFGESQCVSGAEVCQLLEVPPKFPITFSYGANLVRYTFNVEKMELVVTGRAHR